LQQDKLLLLQLLILNTYYLSENLADKWHQSATGKKALAEEFGTCKAC
jgi:hypothetical protein